MVNSSSLEMLMFSRDVVVPQISVYPETNQDLTNHSQATDVTKVRFIGLMMLRDDTIAEKHFYSYFWY